MIIINIICIAILFGMLIYKIYKVLVNEEENKIRTECIEEARRQLEMYEVQYKWSYDLDAKKSLIEKLQKKDLEMIKLYQNMILLLS